MKRVVVIHPSGAEVALPAVPSSAQLRRAVDGDAEVVRVLDPTTPDDAPVYTMMIANETGLRTGLPRNQRATEIYQRNVRLAFPDAANPFKASHDAWLAQFPPGTNVIDITPEHAKANGYDDDPWISGVVVLFEGYTFDEADDAISEANKRAKRARET